MKIFGILAALLVLLVIGSFAYIAVSDVPVQQTTITRDLSAGQIK